MELDCMQKRLTTDPREIELRERINRYEDANHGACWLRQLPIAQMLEESLLYFDGQRYQLHAWCIMPNHVHTLIETREGWRLDSILHTWKSYSAQQANKILQRKGAFWFREYFDRYIRNEKHYHNVVSYIEQNPVQAGLIDRAEAWKFSSAYKIAEARGALGAPASLPANNMNNDADLTAGKDAGAPDAGAPGAPRS